MPPKQQNRGRRSQNAAPELIPIYDILVDKQKQSAVRDLIKKIDALAKNDITLVEKSFLIFILKVCGLDNCVDKISWKQSIQSVSDFLEEMCEQNQKSVFINELYLINPKSKFHKEFTQRMKQFLEVVISDQLHLISDSQIMRNIYELLLAISRCKMRNIRNCSILMSSLMMKRSKEFYVELSNQGSNRRASKLLTIIDEGYLNQIIKPRLKDIDPLIRQKSFQILCSTILELNKQLLTPNRLNQYFTQTLSDNKPKITELCLKSIIKLFEADKQKIGGTANRNLEIYAVEAIKILEQLVLLPNKSSCLAMQALLSIFNFNPKLDALKPKIIAKIFEIHGYQKFQEGLKKAVLIFFKSLVPFSSKQELNEHRPLLLIEITHLLCSINSSKLLQTILYQFFGNYSGLFGFDDMFLLLLTQYYHRDGTDVELQSKELSVICTMICEFNLYVRKDLIKSEIKEKEQGLYNKNVLTNCKQIFYEKMVKHPLMAHLYLKLFSLTFVPVTQSLSSYLEFVSDKTLDFVKQQKYLSLAGDNLVRIQQVLYECAAIWKRVAEGTSLRPLIKSFDVTQLVRKESLNDIQIIKAAALVSHFEVQELLSEQMMRKIVHSYSQHQQKVTKLQILTFAYYCHRSMFISLFNSPTQSSHRQYMDARGALMQFIFQAVLNSTTEQTIVKMGAFSILCKTLSLVSNSKISDLPVVYFDPTNDQMETLFKFIGQYIRFEQQSTVGQLSMMMSTISLENQQIKEQILQNIYNVFAACYRLSLHKQSIKFITKCLQVSPSLQNMGKYLQLFFSELIRTEISYQNNNRFVFWRVFGEIMFEVAPEDDQKINAIIIKLIDIYYKFRKGHTQTKSLLSNKLMLYVADFIDKTVSNAKFEDLNIIKRLLDKNYRRFPKQTLQRLFIFFTAKIQGNQDKSVQQMRQFLNKIGKVGKANKKTKHQKEGSDQQSSSESEEERQPNRQNEEQNDEQSRYRGTNLRKEQDIMVERQSRDSRATRSRTKRKNK